MAQDPINVEEELLRQQQEDFEEQQQMERIQAQEEEQQNSPLNQVRAAAVDYAKNAVKNYARNAVKEAATSAAYEGVAATAPIWGPILITIAVILLLIGFVLFGITLVKATCDSNFTDGWKIAAAKVIVSALPGDVCKTLSGTFNGGRSGGAGASASFDTELVRLRDYGIPIKSGIDDRVTPCMANRLLQIYSLSVKAGINWEVTDAYRPGGTTASGKVSAHSRGEAVDIGLRPQLPLGSTDPKIEKVISFAREVGFVPPPGNALNEYINPASNATAGHIHLEFNIPPGGGSYCSYSNY